MKNILILAYQLSPTKGSEYSVAWDYVTHMSKHNRLTVLYGVSGNHLGDTEEMENYARLKGMENVRFLAVKPNRLTNILNWCNQHGFLSYSFYLAYNMWHRQVYHVAQNLIQSEKYDLIHFVGPIGYRIPGWLWQLNLPYMWGPIGGASNASITLLKRSTVLTKLKFAFRNWANSLQLKYNKKIKKALNNSNLLLTATTENQVIFSNLFHVDSIYLPENSIAGKISLDKKKFLNVNQYRFIVIGRLDGGKCINVLLEALLQIRNKNKLYIDIIGDGSERNALEKFAATKGLKDIIRWHGFLPRKEAIKLFNSAHMHVITSAKEGNPTTIWEAMSCGVPTLSFDHCGMHDTICEQCGIRIPICSYEQSVTDLADQIDSLLENPKRFEELANGVLKCAKKYTWEKREQILQDCYDQAIENFSNK